MDSFVTWESLLTFGGCVAGTILVTEFVKKLFGEKVPAQLVSFLIAAVILFVGHLATGTFVSKEALLYLINAAAVSLASNGGFDAIKKAFGDDEKKPPDIDLYSSIIHAPLRRGSFLLNKCDPQFDPYRLRRTA